VAEFIRQRLPRGCVGRVEVERMDLASLASVRAFAGAFLRSGRALALLINNAGTMRFRASPDTAPERTEDGLELVYQVNHLSPFLLTELLLPALVRGAPARVVHVSSYMHRNGAIDRGAYAPGARNLGASARLDYSSYQDTKLMNVVYSKALARRLNGTGVVSHAVHPGAVVSALDDHKSPGLRELAKRFKELFGRSAEEGAVTQLVTATHPRLGNATGRYLSDRCVATLCERCWFCGPDGEREHDAASDLDTQQWLDAVSREITGLPPS
jgi:NAD(P)-dependent dehydrogenase (short-subunit alcohol dehydrogenase family)